MRLTPAARICIVLVTSVFALTCGRVEAPAPAAQAAAERKPPAAPSRRLTSEQRQSLDSDVSSIDLQIQRASAQDERLAGGLNKALIGSELATLRHTRAMLEQVLKADGYAVNITYTVDGKPFVPPANAEAELARVREELAELDQRIAAQTVEADRFSGGLVKALAESTLATMRNTRAMVDQRRAALTYGLPQYLPFNVPLSQPTVAREAPQPALAPTVVTVPQQAASSPPAPPASSYSALETNYYEAEAVIRRHCSQKWPSDFEMRAYCEKQQREAVVKLKTGGPTDVPTGTFATIRSGCAQKWPEDYEMREYCERQQIEGYRKIR